MPPDFETVQALRSDVAHQIARHVSRLGISQLAAARQLDLPQPTLSKIVNGRTSDLSLELLLRVAVRAGLRITLQTGVTPQEAGAYAAVDRPLPGRSNPSRIAVSAQDAMRVSIRGLTPAQRVDAFLEHNELVHELNVAGRVARLANLPQSPAKR